MAAKVSTMVGALEEILSVCKTIMISTLHRTILTRFLCHLRLRSCSVDFYSLFRYSTSVEASLWLLPSQQASVLPIYFLHIYAYTVHLRYPAGNREGAYPVDQVSDPVYIMSVPEACISLPLHWQSATLLHGLCGILMPLSICDATSAES